MMLLVNPGSIMTVAHCPVTDSGASMASLRMLLEMNSISSLTAGWALMLIAMMLPTSASAVSNAGERDQLRFS
jgi:predicted metal-binding membrane protein